MQLSDFEQHIVTVVYCSSLIPLALVIALSFTKKISKQNLGLYIAGFFICALGWEIWFTYGLVDGQAVEARRSAALNAAIPQNINWLLNSLADAAICMIGLILIKRLIGHKALQQWSWPAVGVLFIWFIGQNLYVELVVYHAQLQMGTQLSWAPLVPTGPWFNPVLFEIAGRTATLQGQVSWLIMTPLFYWLLLKTYRDVPSK